MLNLEHKDIRAKVTKLILLYMFALSVVATVGILFYYYTNIEKDVTSFIKQESKDLVNIVANSNSNLDKDKLKILNKKILEKLKKHNLNYIKFYKESLEELNTTNSLEGNQNFHLDINELLEGKKKSILKLSSNGISLETILPIKDKNAHIVGYMAIKYSVPQDKIDIMKNDLLVTLCLVIFSIVIVSLLLVPIILKLNYSLIENSRKIIDSRIETIMMLGKAISKRDTDTGLHNYRVTLYAIEIAEQMSLTRKEMVNLIKGSFLHDIGKLAIRDKILLKPAPLNDEEFEEIKLHVKHGVEIVKELTWIGSAIDVVKYHHEKYDGTGYLEGLKGDEIPRSAMIFAIADVFDALVSKRPYKEPIGYKKSIEVMEKSRGTHFDPEILDIFLSVSKKLYDDVAVVENEGKLKDMLTKKATKYIYHLV